LDVESSTFVPNTDIDTEGTKLQPEETIDRNFPATSAHITREPFCLKISFAQFMIHPTEKLIPEYYPESDFLIERLEESVESIIETVREPRRVESYAFSPENRRQTPRLKVSLQGGMDRSTIQGEQRTTTSDVDTNAELTHEYDRLHCGYCHTVYSEDEKADLAAHLRIKHRVEDPYLTESDRIDSGTRKSFSDR